jgi:hypothetical protein
MISYYTPLRMWPMTQSDVDPIARLTNRLRKIMILILFSLNSIAIIDILSEKAKLNSDYFRENIIKEFDLIVHLAWRKSHITHICRHFDNVPVHNTRTIAQIMAKCEFRRFNHSVYSLDPAP